MGSLNWASGLIPLGHLYLRPLQRYFHSLGLTDRFTPLRQSDPSVLASLLQQWQDLSFLTSGIPIRPFQAEFTIITDASTQGWGAHMGDSQISGTWTPLDCKLHINCLEHKAVGAMHLHHWASVLQGHQVMIAMDNLTVVSYINKQGGTRSHTLLCLVVELSCVTSSEHRSPSKTHSRLYEHDSRPPTCISSQSTDNDRVESPPRNHESDFRILGDSSSGHVCNCFKLPPSSVHVSNSGATSTGGGGSVSGLAGKVDVQVSAISPAQQSNSETTVHTGGRGNSDSPLVASWFPHLLRLCVDHPLFFPYRQDLLSQQDQRYVLDGELYRLHA